MARQIEATHAWLEAIVYQGLSGFAVDFCAHVLGGALQRPFMTRTR